MGSYKVSEPSTLKFLKANGAVVDEDGNVINDASDYWKKVYDQAEPKVAKYLHADGTIDENPGSGGSGADLEDNKVVPITQNGTIKILPTKGKDGMKKVTANVNVPSGGQTLYIWNLEKGSDSVILPVGTFAEVVVGMKGIGCSSSSEYMFEGTVTSISADSFAFENSNPDLTFYINVSNTAIATEFPDLS